MTTDRLRVLFVHSGQPYDRVGGARLRWDALAAGMEQTADVVRFPTSCEKGCDDHPGGPEVEDPRPGMPDRDPYYFYYCPDTSRRLREAVAREDPDVIVFSGLEMTRYLTDLPDSARAKKVYDIKDVESDLRLEIARHSQGRPGYEFYGSAEAARQLGGLERAASGLSDAVWTCTANDRERLAELYDLDPASVWVVPNAVEVPDGTGPRPTAPSRVVFIGKLNYFPGVQAAEYIIDSLAPALWERNPGLDVVLAGAGPSDELVAAAGRAGVRLLADPEDVTPLWDDSILVVPLFLGGGSRLKILQAFARHCPVVSSAKGIEGIPVADGREYLLADDTAGYADAVTRLREDHGLRAALTTAAKEHVAAHNSLDTIGSIFSEFTAALRQRV